MRRKMFIKRRSHPMITTRLRSANKFPRRLPSRTRKYHTFISYALALAHYQTSQAFHHQSPSNLLLMFLYCMLFCIFYLLPVMLFGLTTTKLNKLYYYYYYISLYMNRAPWSATGVAKSRLKQMGFEVL